MLPTAYVQNLTDLWSDVGVNSLAQDYFIGNHVL